MNRKTIMSFVLLMATGCANLGGQALHASFVSMTIAEIPSNAKSVELGAVDEKYCEGVFGKNAGYMDRLVTQAQDKWKADYIRNADFKMDFMGKADGSPLASPLGDGSCGYLTGTAMKLQK